MFVHLSVRGITQSFRAIFAQPYMEYCHGKNPLNFGVDPFLDFCYYVLHMDHVGYGAISIQRRQLANVDVSN